MTKAWMVGAEGAQSPGKALRGRGHRTARCRESSSG